MHLHSFSCLALGTKFKYIDSDAQFVKIGYNKVAKWDEIFKTKSWVGQGVYCFSDSEDVDGLSEEVEVL